MQPQRRVVVTREDPGEALTAVAELGRSGGGWINVTPEIPLDVEIPSTPNALAVFSKRGPAVPLGTWTAPSPGPKRTEPAQVGLQHPLGSRAVPALADGPARLPQGWHVLQDHPRRGLVVVPAVEAAVADVFDWLFVALDGLCPLPHTGRFLVAVYQP